MTDRRRRAASPRHNAISGSVIHPRRSALARHRAATSGRPRDGAERDREDGPQPPRRVSATTPRAWRGRRRRGQSCRCRARRGGAPVDEERGRAAHAAQTAGRASSGMRRDRRRPSTPVPPARREDHVCERQVPPHVADVREVAEQLAHSGLRPSAVRALEVAVLDHGHRRVERTADVVRLGIDHELEVEERVCAAEQCGNTARGPGGRPR
jgi:hypothetical protein